MSRFPRLAAACVAALAFAAPAHAVSLIAGTDLDLSDYDTYGVSAGDPDWFGTELAAATASANETRDGFDGFSVVTDLYDVTAGLQTTVSRATNGKLVFKILPFAQDNNGFFGINGARTFSINGFAGFDVDFAWTGVDPFSTLVPEISRSADGDTISFDMGDPRNAVPGVYEDLLFAVDAAGFTMNGTGSVDIAIDSFSPTPRALSGLLAPSAAVIPLPASAWTLLLGLGALSLMRRRKPRT